MANAPINNTPPTPPVTPLRPGTGPVAPAGQPAATPVAGPGMAADTASTGRLNPNLLPPEVDLDALNIPTQPPAAKHDHTMLAAGTAAATIGALVTFHDQVQSTVRKAAENYQDLQSNLQRIKAFNEAARNGTTPPAGGAAPAAAAQGLSTSAKIFAGARILRGVTSLAALPGDATKVAHDIQNGQYGKAALHGLDVTGDMLGTASGVQAAMKLAGRSTEALTLTREIGTAGGGTFMAKIPIIGTAFAGVDLVSKGVELFRGKDADGNPLPTNKKVGDVAGAISDVASIVAVVTPPPVDAVAGVVAAGAALVQIGADHWDAVKHGAEAVEHGVEHAADAVGHAVSSGVHKLAHALSFL